MTNKVNLMVVLMLVLMLVAVTAVMAYSGNLSLIVDGLGPGINGHCVGSSCTL